MTKKEEAIMFATLGWMYTYACMSLDNNEDLRKEELPKIAEKAKKDFRF